MSLRRSPVPAPTMALALILAFVTALASPSAAVALTRAPQRLVAEPVGVTKTAASAVGYGSATMGGTGGRKVYVTNLKRKGPGSLRAALEASGRRVVVFRVGGTIRLSSPIKIKDPYVTVDGASAGLPGITIRGDRIVVATHEVILRNLRLRPGDVSEAPAETDGLTLNGVGGTRVYNVVIDHLSMLWGPDIGGLAIVGDVSDVTVQHSIMGEGLRLSRHPEGTRANGGHSNAVNVTPMRAGTPVPRRITFWGNLLTTSDERMPRVQGARCVDVINNVIYNWGSKSASGNPRSLNLVANWFRSGPRTSLHQIWSPQTSSIAPRVFRTSVFHRANVTDGFPFQRGGADWVFADTARCGGLSVPRTSAADAYVAVLSAAGTRQPMTDHADRRVLRNVRERAGRYFNGAGYPAPNPYWN